METEDQSAKRKKQLLRNLLAGLAGLAAAAVFVAVTLRLEGYFSPTFLKVALFVFPTPVACGLAVGLVSPRHAVLWAPLWSAVFALLWFAVLSGSLLGAGAAFSPDRLAYTVTGVALAALAGLAGQHASLRGAAGKAVAVFLVLCALMAGAEYALLAHQMNKFRGEQMPEILAEVNSDYMQIEPGLDWQCDRHLISCYRLSAQSKRGDRVTILVKTGDPTMLGIIYRCGRASGTTESVESARAYLKSLGFRDALLASLSKQKGVPGSWCASLKGTRLTLGPDGRVELSSMIGFAD